MKNRIKKLSSLCLSALLLATTLPATAGETEWRSHGNEVSSRLISAVDGTPTGDTVLIGFELRMQPKWKTYWRSPGEAGLPPTISLMDGSTDGIRMEYPLPTRFELFDLQTYGYDDQVIFPVYIDRDLFTDNRIRLKAGFMVCSDICIPYNVEHEMDLGSGEERPAPQKIALDFALDQVPLREGTTAGNLQILGASIQGSKGYERLLVQVQADADLTASDVLPESELPVKFGKPMTREGQDPTTKWFAFPIMLGSQKVSLRGDRVCLTFSDGKGNAIEREFDIPTT